MKLKHLSKATRLIVVAVLASYLTISFLDISPLKSVTTNSILFLTSSDNINPVAKNVKFGNETTAHFIFPKYSDYSKNTSVILVSILSHAENFEQRKWIRNTWFKYKYDLLQQDNVDFAPYFVIGTNNITNDTIINQIRNEFFKYNDLIIFDTIKEGYKQVLSLKSLGSFQIFEKYFLNCNVIGILKTDDDSFVRMNKILFHIKQEIKESNYFYFGKRLKSKKISKEKRNENLSKNAIPYQLWSQERLPDYCVGAGYVLSWNLLKCINKHVKNEHKYYNMPIEDIAVGIYAQMCNATAKWKIGFIHLDPPSSVDTAFNSKFKFVDSSVLHKCKTKYCFDQLWEMENH